jgi:hypothetical protein
MLSGVADVEGVLVIGTYGAGKSTVAVELATLLERQRTPYALVDVDFIGWFGVEADDDAEIHLRTRAANLAAVMANYRAAGVRRFVLARSVRDEADLARLREAAGVPLRVVALTVPFAVVERRLSADPTDARQDDLRDAREQHASGFGEGLAELVLDNDRPLADVVAELKAWLGW